MFDLSDKEESKVRTRVKMIVVMELPLHIIPKVVNLEVQLGVEVQTRWVVIVVNSMVGSNNS